MNTQTEAFGAYVRRLQQALHRKVAVDGNDAYRVEISEAGLTMDDAQMLR